MRNAPGAPRIYLMRSYETHVSRAGMHRIVIAYSSASPRSPAPSNSLSAPPWTEETEPALFSPLPWTIKPLIRQWTTFRCVAEVSRELFLPSRRSSQKRMPVRTQTRQICLIIFYDTKDNIIAQVSRLPAKSECLRKMRKANKRE